MQLPRTLWVLSALFLSVVGLFVYTAVGPKASCSASTRYIHAAVQSAAAAVVQPIVQQPIIASTPVNTTQGLLSGLLHPEQAMPAFLDAALKASSDPKAIRQLVQLQQSAFCHGGHHKLPIPGTVGVPFGNVTLYVYGAGDIVSNSLKQAHSWERTEIDEWLWAIRQWKPAAAAPAAAAPAPAAPAPAQERPLTVDIGANLGWFTLNAAAAGARVAAFEAMPANIALIRRSLCASPWLAERVALYGTGLGEEAGACYIISGTDNKGDGFIKCNKTDAYNTKGYEVRGIIPLRRLDTLLDEDVQVLKIDVEGFEQKVLTGAKGLLLQYKVQYLMAECNTGIIGLEAGRRFIQFLHQQGYEVSPHSFKGPYWSADQIPTATCSNINLFARRRPT